MNKKYEVQLYYTRFSTYLVDAEREGEAILKARKEKIKLKDICSNLENWADADIATAVEMEEK